MINDVNNTDMNINTIDNINIINNINNIQQSKMNPKNMSIKSSTKEKEKNPKEIKEKHLSDIDIYMKKLEHNCETFMMTSMTSMTPILNVLTKEGKDKNTVNDHFNFSLLTKYKYNIQELKEVAKKYKVKLSGNKKELLIKLYTHIRLSFFSVKIQKLFRGFLQRLYNSYKGPACLNRSLCNNKVDFLTFEEIQGVSFYQFISYKDEDNFIYGFDLPSLYNLIKKSGSNVQNPYNRNTIPKNMIKTLQSIIQLSRILHFPIETEIDNHFIGMTEEKTIQLRALDLFQEINSLGNYSECQWFLNLSVNGLHRLYHELLDIWNYRCQLTNEVKCAICPPYGNPFLHYNGYILNNRDVDSLKKILLTLMENFVKTSATNENRSLGAYYVLGALTLVNKRAAAAIPWLYESFLYQTM